MRFKRLSAGSPKRNLLGRKIRGRLPASYLRGMDEDDLLNLLDAGWLLPVAGGTVSSNTVMANAVYFPKASPVSTDQTVNQGDLVWWDPINYTLKPLTTVAQVAVSAVGGFCGVAQGSNVPNVYPDVPGGIPSEKLPGVIVQRGGTVKLNSTTGDGSYFPYEPVTVGADAQTVSRGGQTSQNRLGFVITQLPVNARGAPGATPAPETVPGGTALELWLEVKFPNLALL